MSTTTSETQQETLGFQAEIRQLLDLMIHSLYSNKEIFLRELISNAADATDKLRFAAIQDDTLYEQDSDLKIQVSSNNKLKTITITDNGIGMSRAEITEQLGTIAKSGSRQFLNALQQEQGKDTSNIIGQFGVGFYSAFIVAERVEVKSRKAGLATTDGVLWISSGEENFTVETIEQAARGTEVTLFLRKDAKEFLESQRLQGIIKTYSDHLPVPVMMPQEDNKDEWATVNSATALWTRSKRELKAEDYHEFYKHISHDFEDPMAYVHNKVEGKTSYHSLLFIPQRVPFDLWDKQQMHGLKLYVRRVFITDDAEQLIPRWLRFVRGIVDSDDLPLNVSREMLQSDKTIDTIRAGCTKRILTMLKNMAEKTPEKYVEFWDKFGRVLKEGVIEANDKKDDLAKLLRFASSRQGSAEQLMSLDDYIAGMREGQKAIYFITADNFEMAKNSPHLEVFLKNDIEVLLLTDPIDEWVSSYLHEYAGKPMESVSKGSLDLGDLIDANSEDKQAADSNTETENFLQQIQKVLTAQIEEARQTDRLVQSPACLIANKHDMGRHLEQILQASGQEIQAQKPILEINLTHPIVSRMRAETDDDKFAEWSHIIYEQALLSEGGKLPDPAGFVHRLNALLVASLSSNKD